MWRNYLSIAIALGGSLILSVAVTACGTSPSPAWLTATAETHDRAIATGIAATVTQMRSSYAQNATVSAGHIATSVVGTVGRIATSEANPTYQARKATVQSGRDTEARPSLAQPLPDDSVGTDVPEWLITDVANITSRMRALNPYLSTCPLSSSERSRYVSMLEQYERDSANVSRDAADGSVDNYTIRELTSITNLGFEIVGDLEIKCR